MVPQTPNLHSPLPFTKMKTLVAALVEGINWQDKLNQDIYLTIRNHNQVGCWECWALKNYKRKARGKIAHDDTADKMKNLSIKIPSK